MIFHLAMIFQSSYIDKTISKLTQITNLKPQTTMITIAIKFIKTISEIIFIILF